MAKEFIQNEKSEPKTEAEILARSVEYIGQYVGLKEGFRVEIERIEAPDGSQYTKANERINSFAEQESQLEKALGPIREMQSQLAKATVPTLEMQNRMERALGPIREIQSQLDKAMVPTLEMQSQMERALGPIREIQSQLDKAMAPFQKIQNQLVATLEPLLMMQSQLAYMNTSASQKLDGIIQIKTVNQQRARFAVEVKKAIEIRDLPQIVRQLESISQSVDSTLEPMIVARYISNSAQKWLRDQQISYADATGNFMVNASSIGTFLFSESGARQDPWRMPGRPRNSFKGASAAPIFRALIDFPPPYSVPELMRLANSSSGVTYRVIDFLIREGLIKIDENLSEGKKFRVVTDANWKEILTAWSTQYSYQIDNSVFNYLEPRGIEEVVRKLKNLSRSEYAVTGSVAAREIAPYSISKQITIYSKYPFDLARELNLRPTQSGANVQLISAQSDVVYDRTSTFNGLNCVATSQIALDLLTGPGRNASEGEELLNWMMNNETTWRKWQ